MRKTIFITGASSGLGKATAKYFQSKGWNVIATMRNPQNENELTELDNITVVQLDVTDSKAISETIKKLNTLHNIDVVFNNAGYGLMGPLESISDEQILKQINTNLLGVIRITKEFIPYFREKKKGTFLTTTSVGGFVAFPIGTIYNATKFALEGWSESLSHELSAFNIKVKTIAPGGINTDFAGRSLDTVENNHYKEVESKMWYAFDNIVESASSADQVAEVVYLAATDEKDQIRYTAGEDAKAFAERLLEIGPENMRLEIKSQILG